MPASPLSPADLAALLPELRAKVEAMTPGRWRPSAGLGAAYVLGRNAFGDPRPELVFNSAEAVDRDGIVALRNAAPALLATVESQAARIAELEAGLREAVKRWSLFAVSDAEIAAHVIVNSLITAPQGAPPMIDTPAHLRAEIGSLRAQLAEARGDSCTVCDDDGLIWIEEPLDGIGAPLDRPEACPECGGTKSGYASRVTKERDAAIRERDEARERIAELEALAAGAPPAPRAVTMGWLDAMAGRVARWKDRDPAIDLSPNEMVRAILADLGITVTERPSVKSKEINDA